VEEVSKFFEGVFDASPLDRLLTACRYFADQLKSLSF